MATSTSPLSRQPDNLDYLSPTQFKFNIHQLPKVEFFCTAANVPAINLGEAVFPTPYKEIPVMGDTLTYDNLSISFIVDENLENYIELHNWLTAIGFPKNRNQFSTFRSSTASTPIATQGTSDDIGDVQPATSARGMFGDAILTILTNKNNPVVEVRFQDIYPVALGALDFTQTATDVEYITVTADFSYKIYDFVTL
jgi:hypothetical protein|tara:strand:- start:840 stop:1430 length:591 start_codon:yes stop_codon:yes gene_type:complete